MAVPLIFATTSRYYGLETFTVTGPGGAPVVCLRRRFLPHPERLAVLQEHTVEDGERIDQISASRLGDPLLWWRIADANRALNPDRLVEEPGWQLHIALPEGVPGLPNA